jgi:drug/metabolite transporter (DMT)-like permease
MHSYQLMFDLTSIRLCQAYHIQSPSFSLRREAFVIVRCMSKVTKAPMGASLVVLSSFFYASYGIWTKLMGDFFQGYTASALRSILVVAILLPIALTLHQIQPLNIRANWRYIAGMVIASSFTWGPLYYAILHAGVGVSLAVTYASIVIGSFLFGRLFVGERLTKDKLVSGALGLVGLGLIFTPTLPHVGWIALAGAVVSGLSAGANTVFSKQIHYNSAQSTLALWTASIVANTIMAFILNEHGPTVGRHIEWLYLLCFAIASIIASWAFIRGVKLIDVGAAGVLGLLEIVFGVVFGVIFFKERPSLIALGGVGVIILAAAIPYIKDYDRRRGTLA